jgi:RND superfamily putative drug exporter
VGGATASFVDIGERIAGRMPLFFAFVVGLSFLLLMAVFRSVVVPVKAAIMNLLSVGAAYGVLVPIFQWGWGDGLLDIRPGPVEAFLPMMLFAILFGLSMDYEVFLVSRMREEWDRTHDNEHAVSLGLAKTGRIVTAAGLIMVAAFMGFVAGSIVGLQQFGFGLAVAIALDVTIVRALLVPSAMKLFGRLNWWLPANVARVVRVPPSPLEPSAQPAVSPSAR